MEGKRLGRKIGLKAIEKAQWDLDRQRERYASLPDDEVVAGIDEVTRALGRIEEALA